MNRCALVRVAILAVSLLAAALAVEAQPAGKVYRIGWLSNTPSAQVKAIGLPIPASLLLRADQVIE